MSIPDKKLIITEAIKARSVILDHKNEINENEFGHFPKGGGCSPLSEFFGLWLQDKGVVGLQVVCGTRKKLQTCTKLDSESHAWLECGDHIIDLTGDQFSDFDEEVFVSSDRTFHNKFEVVQKSALQTSLFDGIDKFNSLMHNKR